MSRHRGATGTLARRREAAAAAVVAAVVAACLSGTSALAAVGRTEPEWISRLQQRLDELLAAARPAPVPPTPVEVRWSLRPAGELGEHPVLALAALDVDGDGADELLALTDSRLRVLRARPEGFVEVPNGAGELPLGGPVASLQPRAPVGALAVARAAESGAGPRLMARSSAFAWAQGFDRKNGALVAREPRGAGFALCPELAARLVPGRHYFDGATARWAVDEVQGQAQAPARPALPARFLTARCYRGPDPAGITRESLAVVDVDGLLSLYDLSRPDSIPLYVDDVGYAVAIADVDSDGFIDVVAASDAPPGAPDRLSVYSVKGAPAGNGAEQGVSGKAVEVLRVFYSEPLDGGVVAATAGDFDGDGRIDVVAALRPAAGGPVTLWRLN